MIVIQVELNMKHFWDKEYKNNLRIWGDNPSELAVIAVRYLKSRRSGDKNLSVLDIGCGYGRDCLYLAKHLDCCDFIDFDRGKYDIIFASNLYQILHRKQREDFREKIAYLLIQK
jgi:SAM-dependent methyltransferase